MIDFLNLRTENRNSHMEKSGHNQPPSMSNRVKTFMGLWANIVYMVTFLYSNTGFILFAIRCLTKHRNDISYHLCLYLH